MTFNSSRFGSVFNCLIAMGIAGGASDGSAQQHGTVRTVTLPQIGAIEAAKSDRSGSDQKVSSQLLDSIKESNAGIVVNSAPALQADQPQKLDNGVIVDIKAKVTSELLAAIAAMNGRVINKSVRFSAVRATVPLASIRDLAKRPEVNAIEVAAKSQTNASMVAREGAIAHAVDVAALGLGVTGKGIKVGVISDSLDDASHSASNAGTMAFLGTAKLTALPGQSGDGEGEGLAMLEIVHAIAPDAELFFATGNGGPAQMAENIIELAERGCNVIVDDLTYFNESPFQDDAISMAVDEVSSNGVLYFSSARNSGNKAHETSGTWEGDFQDGGPAGARFAGVGPNARVHVFENGVTLNTVDKVGIDDRVDLFWSDPLTGSMNGYDLFVVNKFGQVVRSSTTSHTGTQPPYQSVDHLHNGESIVIVKEQGAAPRFLHLDVGRARLRHNTNGSVRGHNASGADNAFSIAAVRVPVPVAAFQKGKPYVVENFSSDGPRRVFYNPDGNAITPGNLLASGGSLRMKPDLTAADGVSTTLPAGGLNPFFGTSAAAPHVAGIAALMLSCAPRPTPSQVRQALISTAATADGASPNATAGFGVVMAQPAMTMVCKQNASAAPTVAMTDVPLN